MTMTTLADVAAEREALNGPPRRCDRYDAAIHAEAAYDRHAAGMPHDTTACGMPHASR